jgi:hypothetical protein
LSRSPSMLTRRLRRPETVDKQTAGSVRDSIGHDPTQRERCQQFPPNRLAGTIGETSLTSQSMMLVAGGEAVFDLQSRVIRNVVVVTVIGVVTSTMPGPAVLLEST